MIDFNLTSFFLGYILGVLAMYGAIKAISHE